MQITYSIFNQGCLQLDNLCQHIGNQQKNSQQRVRYALLALKIITASFDASKNDPQTLTTLTFKEVATCCEKLASLSHLVFKPKLPPASPSKFRVNHERVKYEREVAKEIVLAQKAVIGSWFAKINYHLALMHRNLSQFAWMKSQENQQIYEDYTSKIVEIEDLLEASDRFAANLKAMQELVARTSATASLIQKKMSLENVDMSLASEEDLQRFEALIDKIYSEYDKISDSLTFFQRQNDPLARMMYYRSHIKHKIAPSAIEEDGKGNFRHPLPVLKDYKRMIKGCYGDLKMVLNEVPASSLRVVRAYAELEKYNTAKNDCVDQEMEICDVEKTRLKEKLDKTRAHYITLRESSSTTKKELEEACRKIRSKEEKCIYYAEYAREIEKAAEKGIYFDAESLLDDVKTMPEYSAYLSKPTFDFLVKIPTDHWLLAPISLASITELEQAVAGFKRYDDAINLFKKQMRGFASLEPALKPFIFLKNGILGTDRPKD